MALLSEPRKPRFLSNLPPDAQPILATFQPLGDALPTTPAARLPGSSSVFQELSRGTPQTPELAAMSATELPIPGALSTDAIANALQQAARASSTGAPSETPVSQSLLHALSSLQLVSDRLSAQARSDALEIGFQVARRILEMEITQSPEPLFALIRAALRRAGDTRHVRVRLHPEDVLRVQEAGGAPRVASPTLMQVELVDDPSLKRGDCVVETDFGLLDGRLDTRLAELRQVAESAVHSEPA